MFFNQYPYLNLNDLNLDYILKAIGEMKYEVTNFVSINAIKYADPIQWNITSQYEKNTIVIDPVTGTAYISVAPVPAGVALTRPEYWTVVFDLGSFVTRAAQNFTSRWESETTTTATFPTNTGEWLVWGDVLYKALTNITAGDTYVVNGNIEHFTIEDLYNAYLNTVASILGMIGDLVDLNTVDKTNLVAAINEVVANLAPIATKLDNLKLYNVKDYGAVGDGLTDDTQAIIDCLAANHFAYFPIGTYIITSTIFIDTGDTIVGEDKDNTIIKQADGANIDMIKTVGFDSLKGTDDHTNKQIKIAIKNITIDGNYRATPDDFNIGVINNTAGTGVSMYCGGALIDNVTIYNCPDTGLYTEWNSYLSGSIVPTAQECRYNKLTIKSCGMHGWDFHGPHDSNIVELLCATNNRKNGGYCNMYVAKGGFKMTTSHLYSDYGTPKVFDSLHIESGADPLVIVNSDIEGGGSHDLYVGNSDNIFANCRFYACFGYGDIYFDAGAVRNSFVGCHCDGQATETGITPPTWNGAIEFGDGLPTYNFFEFTLKNTNACNYYAGEKYNQWIIHGYNQQYLLDGYYRAIPDVATYTYWQKDNIIINGDFADQSTYCWLNVDKSNDMKFDSVNGVPTYFDGINYVPTVDYMKYDSVLGAAKYFDGANYVGVLNSAQYSPSDYAFKFFDGANYVIPNGAVRYDSGTSKLQYASAGSWYDVP